MLIAGPAAGDVTNEFGQLNPHPNGNFTALVNSTIGPAVTPDFIAEMERIYPAPIANASLDTNTYASSSSFLLHLVDHLNGILSTAEDNRGWTFMNEYSFNGAAFAIARAAKKAGLPSFYYRFNAPQTQKYPAYYGASHSADNWHLQNATSEMNATEKAVAYECVWTFPSSASAC